MFARLRQRLGAQVADGIDLLVQFSTLGEYAVDQDPPGSASQRRRGDCAPPRWTTRARARGGEARP